MNSSSLNSGQDGQLLQALRNEPTCGVSEIAVAISIQIEPVSRSFELGEFRLLLNVDCWSRA